MLKIKNSADNEHFMSFVSDHIAIVDDEGKRATTYSQLDRLSEQVADGLKAAGIKPGAAVIVCMGRCMEYIAAELGILKAGCAVVPLLTEYPEERVNFISEDCGAEAIIKDESLKINILQNKSRVPRDTALLIYTSGSTGKPKGVVYSRHAFEKSVERLAYMMQGINPLRFGSVCPFSFVAKLFECYSVMSLGGTVHILSETTRRDMIALQNYLADNKLTMATLTSRMLCQYRNHDEHLKRVITGSERLSNFYTDEFEVLSVYGQSEGMGTSLFFVDKAYDNTPIGKPFAEVEMYIADEAGKPLPQGEEGEICVTGYFASEYLNLPEQTAETFQTLPDGRTRIRTKDIGKQLPDGNFLYINRKDWMVKINGQRVDTGEVERTMKACLKLKQVVVKDFQTAAGQVYLVAFYTSDEPLEETLIKRELSKLLPAFMIPTHFVALETFPLTVTGKVDRTSLKVPILEDDRDYVAPKTAEEIMLCEAFQKVLKMNRISADDDFFALGGDSIGVLALQNVINRPGFTTQIAYKGRTPRGIAALLDTLKPDSLFDKAMSERRQCYPLTAAQLSIYYQCHYNPEGKMYDNPFTIKLDEDVDIQRLKSVWQQVLNHHLVFRAEVEKDEKGLPHFVVRDKLISNNPLLSYSITQEVFSMRFHHLIFDGASFGIMLRELSKAYNGEEIEPETVNPLAMGIYEQVLKDTKSYHYGQRIYHEMFDGKDCDTMLPYEMPETDADDIPCKELSINISEAEKETIDQFIAQKGITANNLFLWAFQRTLSEAVGKRGVHFCTGYHGRDNALLHNAVGMMVKTLPLYFEIESEWSIEAQLQQVDSVLHKAIDAADYPYAKVADAYGLDYRCALVYQGDDNALLKLGEKSYIVEPEPVGSAQTDLVVMVLKYPERYRIRIQYRSDCYRQETMAAFAENFKNHCITAK